MSNTFYYTYVYNEHEWAKKYFPFTFNLTRILNYTCMTKTNIKGKDINGLMSLIQATLSLVLKFDS